MRTIGLVLAFAFVCSPSLAADVGKLNVGSNSYIFWHSEKWAASCTVDKVDNKSTCSAELYAFDLPEPKTPDLHFYMIANRLDLHLTIIRNACVSYLFIDPPHLKLNPATEISWRSGKMTEPTTITSFRDVAGGRLFRSDGVPSLQRAVEAEGAIYLKTASVVGPISFLMSTKGYRMACQSVLAKKQELNRTVR